MERKPVITAASMRSSSWDREWDLKFILKTSNTRDHSQQINSRRFPHVELGFRQRAQGDWKFLQVRRMAKSITIIIVINGRVSAW